MNDGVATAEELKAFLTSVIRGEAEGRLSEKIKATDLLGKAMGLWSGQGVEAPPPIIIHDLMPPKDWN